MSRIDTADEWELIVPGQADELEAEFRRHGVKPGQRVHVAVLKGEIPESSGETLPSFLASFDGPADLGERSGEILSAEFPHAR